MIVFHRQMLHSKKNKKAKGIIYLAIGIFSILLLLNLYQLIIFLLSKNFAWELKYSGCSGFYWNPFHKYLILHANIGISFCLCKKYFLPRKKYQWGQELSCFTILTKTLGNWKKITKTLFYWGRKRIRRREFS